MQQNASDTSKKHNGNFRCSYKSKVSFPSCINLDAVMQSDDKCCKIDGHHFRNEYMKNFVINLLIYFYLKINNEVQFSIYFHVVTNFNYEKKINIIVEMRKTHGCCVIPVQGKYKL